MPLSNTKAFGQPGRVRRHPFSLDPMTDTASQPTGQAGLTPQAEPPAPPDTRTSLLHDLGEIGRDLWGARDLLLQLTRRDVTIRYKQAVMGFGWALFMPLMTLVASVLIRALVQTASGRGMEPASIIGMAVKSLPWAFFVGSLGFATPSLIANANLVTKIYFPREVLPLSAVLAQCFDTSLGVIAFTLALPFLGFHPTWALLWVPVLVVLLFLFTAGVCLFLSCANLFFRDVKYIVQIFLTFGIFFTPVLFEPSMLGHRLSRIIWVNPLTPLLEGLRLAIAEGHNLAEPLRQVTGAGNSILVWSPASLWYSGVWAVAGCLIGAVIFHRAAHVFAEYA